MVNVLFAWPCLGLPLALPWFGLVPLRGIVFELDLLVFDPSCIFGICITFWIHFWFIWRCFLALGSLFVVPWSVSLFVFYTTSLRLI